MNLSLYNIMALAAEEIPPAQEVPSMGGSLISLVLMLVPAFLLMYFLMIRPERKKQKAAKQMRDSLMIGDEVVTVGGIVGIIISKTEDTVLIETGGSKSKIRVKSWAISDNLTIHDDVEESAKG
jgi:preprotein translocase subunit YajC